MKSSLLAISFPFGLAEHRGLLLSALGLPRGSGWRKRGLFIYWASMAPVWREAGIRGTVCSSPGAKPTCLGSCWCTWTSEETQIAPHVAVPTSWAKLIYTGVIFACIFNTSEAERTVDECGYLVLHLYYLHVCISSPEKRISNLSLSQISYFLTYSSLYLYPPADCPLVPPAARDKLLFP